MTLKLSSLQRFKGTSVTVLAIALSLTWATGSEAQTAITNFDVPAENAAQALNDFARQANVQILFPYEAASGFSAPAVHGRYSREAALSLILANTNLEVAAETGTTITLRAGGTQQDAGSSSASTGETATEVIITGTHIRGANPTSPIHTVSRKDIETSGYSEIGDVMRSLPENFSGGQNPGVLNGDLANAQNVNASNASTVNLRGLGTDATLVLLNGHRLAADLGYQAPDISVIPLGAVQRIDIIPDGASALYGADAVAGVVNMVLRRNFQGGELDARLGSTAQGGGEEQTYSGLLGTSGSRGYVLGSAEYSKRGEITEGQRKFLGSQIPDNYLVRPQVRKSAFLGAGYDLSDRATVTFDGLFGERTSRNSFAYSPDGFRIFNTIYTASYSAAATLDYRLAADWKLHATGVLSGSRDNVFSYIPAFSYSVRAPVRNTTKTFELTADGSLLTLPSGDVKAAVGAGYRTEAFRSRSLNKVRDIKYIFGEASIPLVTPDPNRVGLDELELSLSGRVEDYSDFGRSSDPKIGFRYVPSPGLTLRSTWGRSFKAPTFSQMYDSKEADYYTASDLGYSGSGTAILLAGGNPDLRPERSTSWTFGGDFSPAFAKRMTLSATYYSIDFQDRVLQPVNNFVIGLGSPLYAPFQEFAPSQSRIASVVAAAPLFYNFSDIDYDPTSVVAILHDEYTNASSQTVQGVDLSYRQNFDVGGGDLGTFFNGTWLTLKQQTIATAPVSVLSGKIYNLPRFKGRGGATWHAHALTITGIVNHIGRETDDAVSPSQHVGSWTTFDLNASYVFTRGTKPDFKLSLSAINLFDQDPPRTVSPLSGYGVHFDSTNTSILGRFVSVTGSVSW